MTRDHAAPGGELAGWLAGRQAGQQQPDDDDGYE
jgi:hypothetical protein